MPQFIAVVLITYDVGMVTSVQTYVDPEPGRIGRQYVVKNLRDLFNWRLEVNNRFLCEQHSAKPKSDLLERGGLAKRLHLKRDKGRQVSNSLHFGRAKIAGVFAGHL